MLAYAETLQSLELYHTHHSWGLWTATEHHWRTFTRLSSLSVSRNSYRPSDSFFRALREMYQLTQLSFAIGDPEAEDFRVFAECLPSLTELRSLSLSGSRSLTTILPGIVERNLMTLTQLTELCLKNHRIGHGQRFPTGIQSLTCSFSGSPPANIAEILMSMTNLTSLSVLAPWSFERLFRHQGVKPSQFSQELGRLKHLSTLNVLVDDLFLEALGMLTQLTSLQLENTAASLDPYLLFPRSNNLSELVELKISSPVAIPVRNGGLPQLCLPKLRKLDLPLRGTDDNMRKELWKTLPCLRKMLLLKDI